MGIFYEPATAASMQANYLNFNPYAAPQGPAQQAAAPAGYGQMAEYYNNLPGTKQMAAYGDQLADPRLSDKRFKSYTVMEPVLNAETAQYIAREKARLGPSFKGVVYPASQEFRIVNKLTSGNEFMDMGLRALGIQSHEFMDMGLRALGIQSQLAKIPGTPQYEQAQRMSQFTVDGAPANARDRFMYQQMVRNGATGVSGAGVGNGPFRVNYAQPAAAAAQPQNFLAQRGHGGYAAMQPNNPVFGGK